MRYALYRFFANGIKKIPPRALYAFARCLGGLFWYCIPSRRRLATEALQKHLRLSPAEAERIARQSFKENFQSFFEIFHVAEFFTYKSVSVFHSPESIAVLQADDAPIVIATAHLGAWELMPGLATDLLSDREGMVIVRKQKDPALNRVISEMRSARGMLSIDHRQASQIVLPKLRAKGVAAFLVDHNCNRNEAVFLPFLEDIAAVNAGPAHLALRTKASVYPVFLLRDGKGSHILHILAPLRTADLTGTLQERLREIARFYTDAVASMVRQYPEQWFWMHQRWKTREKKQKTGPSPEKKGGEPAGGE